MSVTAAKLKWQCRRGTKELDYLLESYLIQSYKNTNNKEQSLFLELLELEDSVLISYLLGEQLPETKGLKELVKKIRNPSNI